jgi:hypothetical protein
MTHTEEYTQDFLESEVMRIKILIEKHRDDVWLVRLFRARLNWLEAALKMKKAGLDVPRDEDLYQRVWDVLVRYAGAYEDEKGRQRRHFIWAAMERDRLRRMTEYRFSGKLGFGGKIWRDNGTLYVTCYKEDQTKQRQKTIERVNTVLRELQPACGVWGPP